MKSASFSDNRKRVGRPSTGVGTLIGVRLSDHQLEALDRWREEQEGNLTRPEAIRQLVSRGLIGK